MPYLVATIFGVGSSPLARGAPFGADAGADSGGLIPARAGSTSTLPNERRHRRAHPRSRGEHILVIVAVQIAGGSSPLARGALEVEVLELLGTGLIPARAGSTSSPALS